MDQQTAVYLILTIGIVVGIFWNSGAFAPFNLVIVALCGLTIILIFVLNFADFVIFPVVTNLLGIKIVPSAGYYIPKSSNALVKYVNGIYYATGYLTANVFNYVFAAEGIDETENQKLGEAPDKWERIVMNAGFPFRFNVMSVSEDVQKYREELEGIRGTYEFTLDKEEKNQNPSQTTIDELNKKMSIIDARLSRLSAGERPIFAMMYIESTAVGVSEKDALDALTNQLSHLQTLFNSFDLSIARVVGREIYHLATYNYLLPDTDLLQQTFTVQK